MSIEERFQILTHKLNRGPGGVSPALLQEIDDFMDSLEKQTAKSYNDGYDRGRIDAEGRHR